MASTDASVFRLRDRSHWQNSHNANFPESCDCLGGGLKHFLFSPLPGEMIQFD